MNTNLKTPGVYVQELDAFPPSVAEVATAIPAFIGYTEMATNITTGDLHNVPTRITSMLEYELYFGGGPEYTALTILVNPTTGVPSKFISAPPTSSDVADDGSRFFTYDSVRLFFDNGGGTCYIVSIGLYDATPASDDFIGDTSESGLATLTKYDEPSLLVFPDAVNLSAAQLASVQQAALLQCSRIGNRFCILDMHRTPKLTGIFASGDDLVKPLTGSVDIFRSNIGMNNLKYGAVYGSWIQASFSKSFALKDIALHLVSAADGITPVTFQQIVTGASPLAIQLDAFGAVNADNTRINGIATLTTPANAAITHNIADHNPHTSKANIKDIMVGPGGYTGLVDIIVAIDGLLTTPLTNASLASSLTNYVSGTVYNIWNRIGDIDALFVSAPGWMPATGSYGVSAWTGAVTSGALTLPAYVPDLMNASDITSVDTAISAFQTISQQLAAVQATIIAMGTGLATNLESHLVATLPNYSTIISMLTSLANTIPPSGAVAGVYAATDNTRGVWKAPANVSINNVMGVDVVIDDAMQENMNVDTVSGKSVNAIRPFFSEGILVWGARTLDGNSNDWRYVPVRRFTSMVEESCKRSTKWAVFEPNDANLWVKVRSEVENFLYTQWRAGALAGAKPEEAFYVHCGLGTTMTSQDILNGYLIVKIGMAVVRPAEFIILEFTQMLQVS